MTNPGPTSLMAAVGDEGPAASVSPGTTGLDSRSRSEDLALGSVGFCATEASRWLGTDLTVDPGRVGANFRSLGHLRLDGAAFPSFAPLSGFFEARDGWVRTHANDDWHRARLAAVLGLDADERRPPTKEDAAAAIRSWRAQELEDAVTAAGGIAARVRTAAEFGAVVGPAPLLTVERGVTRAVRSRRIRVLDLTRVIAGPVATRTLAALGMDSVPDARTPSSPRSRPGRPRVDSPAAAGSTASSRPPARSRTSRRERTAYRGRRRRRPSTTPAATFSPARSSTPSPAVGVPGSRRPSPVPGWPSSPSARPPPLRRLPTTPSTSRRWRPPPAD